MKPLAGKKNTEEKFMYPRIQDSAYLNEKTKTGGVERARTRLFIGSIGYKIGNKPQNMC
jgi:hypothetical protein